MLQLIHFRQCNYLLGNELNEILSIKISMLCTFQLSHTAIAYLVGQD